MKDLIIELAEIAYQEAEEQAEQEFIERLIEAWNE